MRLDVELVTRGLSESRTEAQELIDAGYVLLNGEVCTKQTRLVSEVDTIVVTARRKYVSRGGEKLEGVCLDIFGNEEVVRDFCKAKIALDAGSSTGGFTDYLLSMGVGHVDAVDVGTEQFHHSLRERKEVSLFEQTDIRDFTPNTLYDIVVADLSFIPLDNVLSKLVECGKDGATYILLLKPQFEVGKGGTKKGIVKDDALVEDVLTKYKELVTIHKGKNITVYPCRIAGGGGNQEYFLYFTK
ncbi:MAG: TlyA family RNA methyltransferase [Candidatus Paceibacterota bacterium]